jgi:hypothetical protein
MIWHHRVRVLSVPGIIPFGRETHAIPMSDSHRVTNRMARPPGRVLRANLPTVVPARPWPHKRTKHTPPRTIRLSLYGQKKRLATAHVKRQAQTTDRHKTAQP